MNADDEVKRRDRIGSVLAFARRTVPDLRRNAETIEPIEAPGKPGSRVLARIRPMLWRRAATRSIPDAPQPRLAVQLVRNFSIFVLLPTAVIALYLFAFAADQYIVESRFAVRGEVEPMGDVSMGQFSGLIQKNNSQDTHIVTHYIASQAMVEDAEKALNVSKMFSRDEGDYFSRYTGERPIEDLVKYWRKHVQTHIDLISGVITLSVRTFDPADSLAISKHVITRAELLVNDISERAQNDMLAHSREEVEKSEARLRNAHLALNRFRNRWGIIDPAKSATATYTTLMSLQKDKIKAENDLQVLRASSLDDKARSIQTILASLAAIDQQIKQLRDSLTSDNMAIKAPNAAEAILEYEGLQVERTIANRLNESAVMMLERARIAASRQQVYLATFVPPALPHLSLYPRRGEDVFVVFFFFFALWSCGSLLVAGIKDHNI
ncbi:MAG: capsule biosynthesis protein [Methylobacterium frigidaeris]